MQPPAAAGIQVPVVPALLDERTAASRSPCSTTSYIIQLELYSLITIGRTYCSHSARRMKRARIAKRERWVVTGGVVLGADVHAVLERIRAARRILVPHALHVGRPALLEPCVIKMPHHHRICGGRGQERDNIGMQTKHEEERRRDAHLQSRSGPSRARSPRSSRPVRDQQLGQSIENRFYRTNLVLYFFCYLCLCGIRVPDIRWRRRGPARRCSSPRWST